MLTIAAVADDPELVSRAIAFGDKADLITSVNDGTALIAAAHLEHREILACLVAGGASLDDVNGLGWTALMEAAVFGDGDSDYIKTVQMLVAAGADKSIVDRDLVTPLKYTISHGYAEIVNIIE